MLTDNFTGFVIHRQDAPETHDCLAKLMRTTAIWQSTDHTTGHGAAHSGHGSRRRVLQFRIGSDTFAELRRGEAIIHSTLGGQPQRTQVIRARLRTPSPTASAPPSGMRARSKCHPTSTLDQLVPDSPARKERPKLVAGGGNLP